MADNKKDKKGFGAFIGKLQKKVLGIKDAAKKWKKDFMDGKDREYHPVVRYRKRIKDAAKATE